jgi:hypothetical protein
MDDCQLSYIIKLLKSDSFPSPTVDTISYQGNQKSKEGLSAYPSIKTRPNFERSPKLVAYYVMLKPLPIMSCKAPG